MVKIANACWKMKVTKKIPHTVHRAIDREELQGQSEPENDNTTMNITKTPALRNVPTQSKLFSFSEFEKSLLGTKDGNTKKYTGARIAASGKFI